MKPRTQITPPDWMNAPQTVAVMGALNDPGDRQTLFVGGCVRNALLGQPVTDIDLATAYKPNEVIARLQKAGIHYAPTGIDHGTVTAIADGRTFEVTTLRVDVETDGRHATVAFTGDWMKDAERRDFTMNTLLADDQGNVYDPLGRGLADLKAGRVMFVGSPAERIAEDYLRILRFFRFHALYGRGEPDLDALEACSEAAQNLFFLSRERVTQEMSKILAIDDPSDTLVLMFENFIASEFRSQNFNPKLFSCLCQTQLHYKVVNVMARIAFLANMDYDRAGMLMMLSGAQHKFVRSLVMMTRDVKSVDEKIIRHLIYGNDREVVRQLLVFYMTRDGETPEYRRLMQLAETWESPKFPLAGRDLFDLGVTPGPAMGQLLGEVEDWWLAQDFAPDRTACLEKLRSVVETLP